MDKSSLGDRMKMYEAGSETRLMPRLPIIIRLDGKSFSKFTSDMEKPFDNDFSQAMINTAKFLVSKTNAKIAYTQSDEITLLLYDNNVKYSAMFDARVQKICSVFSSFASTYFLAEMMKRFPSKVDKFFDQVLNDHESWDGTGNAKDAPVFDCRAFAVPNKTEAYNAFLWREQDATKNSIIMVAQSKYPHKKLMGLNGNEKQAMLMADYGINWNDFSASQKRGTYVRKEKIEIKLSDEELNIIPEIGRPVDGLVTRSKIIEMDMPPINKIENIIDVLFNKEDPKLKDQCHSGR
jgi:tRNA(His) guanylyltransferase